MVRPVISKPHGRDCPDRCSQCKGATPRVVTQDGDRLLVDGDPVPNRGVELPVDFVQVPREQRQQHRNRGKK